MTKLDIYIISDSIGETGEQIAKATLRQFEIDEFNIKRYPYHNSVAQLEPVIKQAGQNPNSLLVYTTVQEDTRAYIQKMTDALGIKAIDVMGPPMGTVEDLLGIEPLREPGLIRRLDENYFKKVEAVEFAITYDDGKDPRGINMADIVLLGISRTSKTPLSIYLANKLYKVANVPLVPEVDLPKEVYNKDKRRIIGLIAQPEKISSIRLERLQSLGLGSGATYSEEKRIIEELNYSNQLMKDLDCLVIDVTHKSIEETATIIMDHMRTTF